MKCLTIKQPWAWLIFHGKDVENRTWHTKHRGKLLIHSSKEYVQGMPIMDYLRLNQYASLQAYAKSKIHQPFPMTTGCILGHVKLVGCIPESTSVWADPGCWHWVLEDPVLFDEPIPAKGKLKLWDIRI